MAASGGRGGDCLSKGAYVSQQLVVTGSVKLNGSGNGQAFLGPVVVREYWDIIQAVVGVSSQTNEAQCTLYFGTTLASAAKLQETGTGSTGDVYGFGSQRLVQGQGIFAVWAGGDANATATLTLYGTKNRFGARP